MEYHTLLVKPRDAVDLNQLVSLTHDDNMVQLKAYGDKGFQVGQTAIFWVAPNNRVQFASEVYPATAAYVKPYAEHVTVNELAQFIK